MELTLVVAVAAVAAVPVDSLAGWTVEFAKVGVALVEIGVLVVAATAEVVAVVQVVEVV